MPAFRNTVNGALAALNATLALAWREFFNGGVGIQVAGTFSGTLTPQITLNGTDWVNVQVQNVTNGAVTSTITAPGVFFFNAVGAQSVRLLASPWTSGSASATIVALPG